MVCFYFFTLPNGRFGRFSKASGIKVCSLRLFAIASETSAINSLSLEMRTSCLVGCTLTSGVRIDECEVKPAEAPP